MKCKFSYQLGRGLGFVTMNSMGKIRESTQVLKRDMIYEANPRRQQNEFHHPLVGGWVAPGS